MQKKPPDVLFMSSLLQRVKLFHPIFTFSNSFSSDNSNLRSDRSVKLPMNSCFRDEPRGIWKYCLVRALRTIHSSREGGNASSSVEESINN